MEIVENVRVGSYFGVAGGGLPALRAGREQLLHAIAVFQDDPPRDAERYYAALRSTWHSYTAKRRSPMDVEPSQH
jgi:hypothetical protein